KITMGAANTELPGVCAAEIARLVAANATIGGRPIQPSDIAVLVPTKSKAAAIQEALNSFRIPSVLVTDESVFETADARELRIVLTAIAEPGRDRLVRAALATDLLALTAAELDAL